MIKKETIDEISMVLDGMHPFKKWEALDESEVYFWLVDIIAEYKAVSGFVRKVASVPDSVIRSGKVLEDLNKQAKELCVEHV